MRMEGVGRAAAVPLRVGKKMRKRRELDALVASSGSRGTGRLLSGSSDEETWFRRSGSSSASRRRKGYSVTAKLCVLVVVSVCLLTASGLAWICVGVRNEINEFRSKLDTVTSNQDTIQDNAVRDIAAARANITEYSTKLNMVSLEQEALKRNVGDIGLKFSALNDTLSDVKSKMENLAVVLKGNADNNTLATQLLVQKINDTLTAISLYKDELHILKNQVQNSTLRVDDLLKSHGGNVSQPQPTTVAAIDQHTVANATAAVVNSSSPVPAPVKPITQ